MPSTNADLLSFLSGQFFGTTTFPATDLSGQTICLTGASVGGLGFECAKHLVKLNVSHLILTCRDDKKGKAARDAIMQGTQPPKQTKIDMWQLDLDDHDSVLSFCDRINTQLHCLDAFIANAGVELVGFQRSEGIERTLNVNVISTFLSALLVLPKLKQTAKEHNVSTHLSIVGSMAHLLAPDEQLTQIADSKDMFEVLSDPATADIEGRYNLSKLMVELCYRELAQRLHSGTDDGSDRVIVNCVNPGWCATSLARDKVYPLPIRILFYFIGRNAEGGSRTLVHAVTAGGETHGQYLSECQIKPHSVFCRSAAGQETQVRLWKDLATRLENIKPGVTDVVS